jgi:ATP/ADP translocase
MINITKINKLLGGIMKNILIGICIFIITGVFSVLMADVIVSGTVDTMYYLVGATFIAICILISVVTVSALYFAKKLNSNDYSESNDE